MARHVLVLLLATLSSTGCMQLYTYDGVNYTSKEDAFRAQQANFDRILGAINPLESQLANSAVVVCPSRRLIETNGIVTHGGPRERVAQWVVEYLVESQQRDHKFVADVIKRRGIFKEVKVEVSDNPPAAPATGDQIVIFLSMPEPGLAGWYLKAPSGGDPQSLPLDTAKRGPERMQAWLTRLEGLINSGSKPTLR